MKTVVSFAECFNSSFKESEVQTPSLFDFLES